MGPDYSWAADEITVPIATDVLETTVNYVTTDIVYIGDVTVESSADGTTIALEIQKQFDMGFEPQMLVFLSLDDRRERCARAKVSLEPECRAAFPLWLSEPSPGVWIGHVGLCRSAWIPRRSISRTFTFS